MNEMLDPAVGAATTPVTLNSGTFGETSKSVGFELQVAETDVRAKQFACKLVLRNTSQVPVEIRTINYRLGYGVSMQRSDNTSSIDLNTEYDQLRKDIKELTGFVMMTNSKDFLDKLSERKADEKNNPFAWRNIFNLYSSMARNKTNEFVTELLRRIRLMEFPISTAKDAKRIIEEFSKKKFDFGGVEQILRAKIERMQAIEKVDPNSSRAEYIAQLLPEEEFERVYIIKASRKFSSIATYSVAFDVKLAWSDTSARSSLFSRKVERIVSRSSSFSVTPSPITLTLFAIIFSFLGVLLTLIMKSDGRAAPVLSSFAQALV